MTNALPELLLLNHIAFLATHRGTIARVGSSYECLSEKQSFAMTFALTIEDALLAASRQKLLYVPSWIYDELDSVLDPHYGESYSTTYMARRVDENVAATAAIPIDFEVRKVRSSAIDEFGEVQVGGFCETRESFEAYAEWMREANRRNADSPVQHFFVGYLNREPVSCALVVDSASIAGIFAVATLPAHRCRSYSRAVMQTALSDAHSRGFGLTGLSVVRGSAAEQCYLRQGYRAIFRMHILAPKQKNG